MSTDLEARLKAHFGDLAASVDPTPGAVPTAMIPLAALPARRRHRVVARSGLVAAVGAVVAVLVLIGGRSADRAAEVTRTGDAAIRAQDGWVFDIASIEQSDSATRLVARFDNATDEPAVFGADVMIMDPESTPVADPAVWIGCVGDPTAPTVVTEDERTVSVSTRADEIFDCGIQTVEVRPGASLALELVIADVDPGRYRIWLTNIATSVFELSESNSTTSDAACPSADSGDALSSVLQRRITGLDDPGPCSGPIAAILTASTPPCWATCTDGRIAVGFRAAIPESADDSSVYDVLVEWRTTEGAVDVTAERISLERVDANWRITDWSVVNTTRRTAAGAQVVTDYLNALADGRYDAAAQLLGNRPIDAGALTIASGPGTLANQLERWCEHDDGRCTTPIATTVWPTIDGDSATVVATFDTPAGPATRVFTGSGSDGAPVVTGLPPRHRAPASDSETPPAECATDATTSLLADLDGDGTTETISLSGTSTTLQLDVCGTDLDLPALSGLDTERWGQPNAQPALAISDLDADGIDEIIVGATSPEVGFQGDLYRATEGQLTTTSSIKIGPTVFIACADELGPTDLTQYSIYAQTETNGIATLSWNAQSTSAGGTPRPLTLGATRTEAWNITPDSCAITPKLG